MATPVFPYTRGLARPKLFDHPLRLGLVAALIVLALYAVRVYGAFGGNWSAAFVHGSQAPLPPALTASTYIYENSTGYDGQYYRILAHDPWNQRGFWPYADRPGYRWFRLLQPALAWFLAFGQDDWIDAAFVVQSCLWLGLGVFASAHWARRHGLTAAWGLAFLLIPAVMASVERIVLDGAGTALCAAWALCLSTGRWRWAAAAAALAALNRDTGILLAGAGLLWYARQRQWRPATAFGLALTPLAAWSCFVVSRTPMVQPVAWIGHPGYGLLLRLLAPRPLPYFPLLTQALDFLAWLGFAVTLGCAAWMLRRWREGPWMLVAAAHLVLLLLAQGDGMMADPLGYARPMGPLAWIVGYDLLTRGRRFAALAVAAPALILGLYMGKPLAAAFGLKLIP